MHYHLLQLPILHFQTCNTLYMLFQLEVFALYFRIHDMCRAKDPFQL